MEAHTNPSSYRWLYPINLQYPPIIGIFCYGFIEASSWPLKGINLQYSPIIGIFCYGFIEASSWALEGIILRIPTVHYAPFQVPKSDPVCRNMYRYLRSDNVLTVPLLSLDPILDLNPCQDYNGLNCILLYHCLQLVYH